MPLFMWWGVIYSTFTYSEYAWENPAIATMVIFPTQSLITCKQIVASMTRQKLPAFPKTPLIFLLLPLNVYCRDNGIGHIKDEWMLGTIFAITLNILITWAASTIN